jgi:hypothetical protein
MKSFQTKKGTELPLLDMRGKPYLQVAHRLVWFREEKPEWRIETELLVSEKDLTVAKATIRDSSGNIISTAHKREDVKGFADHMEKSETGAIGRALAMVGYGTQFCADELDEGSRLADSPAHQVSRTNPAAPKTINNPAGKITLAYPDIGSGKTSPSPSFDTFGSGSFGFKSTEKDVP